MNILSLFANIGVAEAYLEEIGFNVVVANELVEKRADLYRKIYPHTNMICGDILNEDIYTRILQDSKEKGIDILMATPPCQGMSTAGKKKEFDERNSLVIPALKLIEELRPKYALIENVPEFIKTSIIYNKEKTLLTDVVKKELSKEYDIEINKICTDDYSVPQSRERMIILMTRKDVLKKWGLPSKCDKKVTLEDAIGWIPEIDPFIKDISYEDMLKIFPEYEKKRERALKISKWNEPPKHILRQVISMQHTPTGCTAFDNEPLYKPRKEDGSLVKGFKNTYKRQNWNTPGYTVTMDNRKISSQENVHPGRKKGNIYSDARVLTLFEIMQVMSIPQNWNVPDDVDVPFLRRIIGEGVPSLFIKHLFQQIL